MFYISNCKINPIRLSSEPHYVVNKKYFRRCLRNFLHIYIYIIYVYDIYIYILIKKTGVQLISRILYHIYIYILIHIYIYNFLHIYTYISCICIYIYTNTKYIYIYINYKNRRPINIFGFPPSPGGSFLGRAFYNCQLNSLRLAINLPDASCCSVLYLYNRAIITNHNIAYQFRASEANEVPVSSHIWVTSTTFRHL